MLFSLFFLQYIFQAVKNHLYFQKSFHVQSYSIEKIFQQDLFSDSLTLDIVWRNSDFFIYLPGSSLCSADWFYDTDYSGRKRMLCEPAYFIPEYS